MRASKMVAFGMVIAAGIAATVTPGFAQTQQRYPSKPVRLVVAGSAGSSTDILARLIGPKMSEGWAQPVVVENRPGAGTTLAAGLVAKAAPDGHTLLLVSSAFAVNAALHPKLSYDPFKHFANVGQVASGPLVLVVAPGLGVKSISALVALAKQKPGQITFGAAGIGSGAHLGGELFNVAAGIRTVYVPYKGPAEAIIDTMGGRTQYSVTPLGPALSLIKEGRLVGLAVTTAQRAAALPDVPTLSEAGLAGFAYDTWFGMFAPAGTPRPVVKQISESTARIVNLPELKERMQVQGIVMKSTTSEEFTKFVFEEVARLSKVGKAAGINLD